MPIIKTLEKALFKLIVGMLAFITLAFIVMTICCGSFGSGVDSAASETTQAPEIMPTSEPDSDIKAQIIIYKDGQNDIVECKLLSVFGDNNNVQIANEDIEEIMITGHGNVISYSCNTDPKIKDYGNHNDVWQRWLT